MTSDLVKKLKENPEYQKILAKMSDEERRIAESAAETLLTQFEENVLVPLRNIPKK